MNKMGTEFMEFEQIYRETIQSAYYVARKFLGNDAAVEDVLQEAYIKVMQKYDTYEDRNLRGWVDTIVANKCKDYLKKKNPLLFSDMAGDDDEYDALDYMEDTNLEFQPESKVDYEETKHLLLEIIEKLPKEQKMSIVLFYYEQMSVKEIANICDCSENTIKSRLNYGRKTIKEKVKELEKKGTKLYCVPLLPFLLWLFKEDVKACEVPDNLTSRIRQSVQEASKDIFGNTKSGTMVESEGSTVTKTGVGAAGKTVAGAVVKKAGIGIATKLVIGVVAVAAVAGCIFAGSVLRDKNAVEANPQEIVSDVTETEAYSADDTKVQQEIEENPTDEAATTVDGDTINSVVSYELSGTTISLPCKMLEIMKWGGEHGYTYLWEQSDIYSTGGRRVFLYPVSKEKIPGSLHQIAYDAEPVIIAYGVDVEGTDCALEDLICYEVDMGFPESEDMHISMEGLNEDSSLEEFIATFGTPTSSDDNEGRDGCHSWNMGDSTNPYSIFVRFNGCDDGSVMQEGYHNVWEVYYTVYSEYDNYN